MFYITCTVKHSSDLHHMKHQKDYFRKLSSRYVNVCCIIHRIGPFVTVHNTYCKQDDAGGFHWIVWRQDYATMVDASAKCCVGWATNCEVPFKQVVLVNIEKQNENQ